MDTFSVRELGKELIESGWVFEYFGYFFMHTQDPLPQPDFMTCKGFKTLEKATEAWLRQKFE